MTRSQTLAPRLAPRWQHRATLALAVLIAIDLLWELWLAPLRPGGSWWALKALPLLLLWPGLARGTRRAAQWLALLLPLYATEALVRALTETGRHGLVATAAFVVTTFAFGCLMAMFRARRAD